MRTKASVRSERLLFESAQGARSRRRIRRNFGLAQRGSLAAGAVGDPRDRFRPDCDRLRCAACASSKPTVSADTACERATTDPVQSLLAVGTEHGRLFVSGRPGVQLSWELGYPSKIRHLAFRSGSGFLCLVGQSPAACPLNCLLVPADLFKRKQTQRILSTSLICSDSTVMAGRPAIPALLSAQT